MNALAQPPRTYTEQRRWSGPIPLSNARTVHQWCALLRDDGVKVNLCFITDTALIKVEESGSGFRMSYVLSPRDKAYATFDAFRPEEE